MIAAAGRGDGRVENPNGSPVNSLWATNGLIQLFLILSLFSQSAYVFFFSIAYLFLLFATLLLDHGSRLAGG